MIRQAGELCEQNLDSPLSALRKDPELLFTPFSLCLSFFASVFGSTMLERAITCSILVAEIELACPGSMRSLSSARRIKLSGARLGNNTVIPENAQTPH